MKKGISLFRKLAFPLVAGTLCSWLSLPLLLLPASAADINAEVKVQAGGDMGKVRKLLDAANCSPGVVEVLKLSKAGVEEPVIISFVQNSSTAYCPTADEVVQLRENGVSNPVLTAMLQRGAEIRARAVEVAQATPPPAPAPAPAPAPVVTAPATYPDYSPGYYPTPAAYPYPYPYPYAVGPTVVYGGGFGYGFCGPRFGFCGPRIGVGVRLGGPVVVGGFRGGFHGGFRGGGGHHR